MATPITDVDSFKTFLRDRAKVTWDERGTPYYLSFVAIDLKRQGVNYHTFTGPLRLVQWATSEAIPETKLVSHATIKAKVGLLPSDAEFTFSDESSDTQSTRVRGGGRHGQALVKFVESLNTLPDDVAAGFTIPANVLIALLKH